MLSNSAAETEALGELLGATLEAGDIVLLVGDLGAGKTQLAKGIARALGVEEEVTSPTFNLVLEYRLPQTQTVDRSREADRSRDTDPAKTQTQAAVLRHFDLYRLDAAEELDDIDYFGLLEDTTAISLVEWGDKFVADGALPLRYRLVELTVIDETKREIHIGDMETTRMNGQAAGRLPMRKQAAGWPA